MGLLTASQVENHVSEGSHTGGIHLQISCLLIIVGQTGFDLESTE